MPANSPFRSERTHSNRYSAPIPVHPQWFSATRPNFGEILPRSACWAGGLQRSSPHREPRTSQILLGITSSSSLSSPLLHVFPLLRLSSSFWIHHYLPLFISFLLVHRFLAPCLDTRPLSSLLSVLLLLLFSALKSIEKHEKEVHYGKKQQWENSSMLKGSKTKETCGGLIRNLQGSVGWVKRIA